MRREAAGREAPRPGLEREAGNLAALAVERIRSLPAGEQLAERGARFVLWGHELRDGKPTKAPLRINGQHADSTKPATWDTLEECGKALARVRADGVGFVLAAERDQAAGKPPVVGVDLDGCRDPTTGTIEPRAREVIEALASYAEVSPSGTGVKVYLLAEPVPRLEANKLVLAKANGRGKDLAIEVYATGRYFALTGQHLDGTPDELVDATEAFERLAARIAGEAKKRGEGRGAWLNASGMPSAATLQLLEHDPTLADLWQGEKHGGDITASGLDWSFARELGRRGVAAEEIARVLRSYRHGQLGRGKLKGRASTRRLAQLLSEARKAAEGKGGDEQVIRIEAGLLHETTARAASALGRATLGSPFGGYYRRGSGLVRTVRLADAAELRRDGISRARGALVIGAADADALRLALTAVARWERFDGRTEDYVIVDAPAGIAKALIATAPDWAEVPILTGIVEAPTLRPDGTVLDRPGYDPATGLLFDPGGVEFPRVPERPTRAQAEAALAKLRKVLAGFPFVDGASESVALSAIISPLVRKACRAAPLHAFTAPKMASGKTLLATLGGYVATGRTPALMPQADDPNEERKRLLAVLMEGHGVIVIDNIERDLKSDALCTVLTEPSFSDRLLGVSKTVTVPSAAVFSATGNNLAVAGDLSARTVSCALDPGCERPEERTFDVDLHKVVPARRAELAAAALTIVRAYLAAGEPKMEVPNFARFEDWSRFVRKPLVWLGMDDACAGRERVEANDTEGTRLSALLEAWRENYPGEAATVGEAIRLATREPAPKEPKADTATRGRLREAMIEVAGRRDIVDSRELGRFIARHERRLEDGLKFERAGVLHKVVRWQVVGVVGVDGGCSDTPRENCHGPRNGNGESYAEEQATDPHEPPNPHGSSDDVDRWLRGEPA